MGRSYLVLPITTASSTGEAELGGPVHSFTVEPGSGAKSSRAFGKSGEF